MANELLDFKQRDNFEFLEFSPWAKKVYGEERLSKFKNNCENVLDKAKKTVLDLCLLGKELQSLKVSGEWKEVLDRRDNYKFEYKSFEAFCAYTFGFSQTRTTDLLRIAQFIDTRGNEPKFIDDKYAKYNTSQLIELAAVRDYNWKYFNPTMTVAEMRRAKKYMTNGDFYTKQNEPNFNILKATEEWEERQAAKKTKKTETQRSDILPGQVSLLEEVFEPKAEEDTTKNPTSGLAQVCGEEDYIEAARQKAHEAGIPFYEGDADEFDPYVYDGKMSVEDYNLMHKLREEDREETEEEVPDYEDTEDEEDETVNEVPEIENETEEIAESKYNFTTRTGVREFLNDFRNWSRFSTYIGCFFEKAYRYWLKTHIWIIAVVEKEIDCNDGELNITREKISYYIWEHEYEKVKEINKQQFEAYCNLHKDEL